MSYKRVPDNLLSLHHQFWDYRYELIHVGFYLDYWDVNSGAHAYIINTLPTKHFLQALSVYLHMTLSSPQNSVKSVLFPHSRMKIPIKRNITDQVSITQNGLESRFKCGALIP